ncbi:hypothetical protein C2S04_07610 [Helicobacter pylori]|uniref:hypothetical protein n=1 Tax=Helicobacter pylori TaxID=210 RepID=UPI000D3AE44D|nr:hypothetical protein [Helicobacter pylori]PUD16904.1 hypothetical protein C2S04_07610 [Helicobacter pylori]QDY55059.1 hypothetical protein CV724_05185 [Helicobacter pylori]
MQDFINGFLKAWKAWSDDGKDAFLESFLDEVKNSKNDPTNFLGILEQEIKSLSQEGLKDDISSMLEVIESIKNEISKQDYEENQIQRAGEISIAEHENKLEKEELERYALEGENKALEQYYESQNPDTLYEQQVFQEQEKEQEKELLNQQDLELETLRDNNTKQGLDNESATLLESLQVIRDETNEVITFLNPNELELLRPTGENTTSKIASIALEESNKLNEKESNTQEQGEYAQKEQEKKTPSNDIDLKDKYASLHSFFKQTELDIKQKRIKTKLDFKESFLNYAKNHMNEDELKVLLVVSQKEPTKLTKEHINLIKDCLEQAHGNKHMQDKGLQLSVKSILGHQLEKEHHEVLKDYLAKSKDSLEPMDNRVYEVMRKHLDKQQAKTLKNLDSATQSVGVNAIKEQNKANKNSEQPKNSQNEPRQETTNAQTNSTATQQENTKQNQAIEQNGTTQAKEPQSKQEPKKTLHPDEPWLNYDPKAHKCLQERQKEEIQEKAQSNNSDEPWIEHGKRMQEKAKAHYQACLEREKAKELAKEQNNAQKEMPTIDYGYTQNTLSKSRRR